jgi:glutamate---cysteine ligase / carboxylate-amine ligase
LPFIVAMAASSPFSEGSRTGNLCQRMVHYAGNCRKIPAITGLVVPDVYRSEQEYQEKVFDAIEAAIRPLDPEGILEPEWTNARGAIARFSRGAIEIRVMDTQEAPVIDLAILQFVVQWLKQLVGEEMSTLGHQESVSTNLLADQLFRCVAGGMQAEVNDDGLLKAFGLRHGSPMLVKDVLESILPQLPGIHLDDATILERLCQSGSLAARILEATGHTPHHRQLHHIYSQLSGCLAKGHSFSISQHP